ncbi:MAG: cyclic nucleotide-binding domain-containing protein [Nitrospirae bacterium]|nr:cyclic nucleotide-binding domain-containing protein [Nitrospirota bacterium]
MTFDDVRNPIEKKAWDKALEASRRLAAESKKDGTPLLRTAELFLKAGRGQEAVACYTWAADIFASAGFLLKAIAATKLILRLDPTNAEARTRLDNLAAQHSSPAPATALSPAAPSLSEGPPSIDLAPSRDPAIGILPLFEGLPEEAFQDLVGPMALRQLDDGTEIIREGETGTSLFVLIHGEVDVETSVHGKGVHLARLRENDFFGEIGFLTGQPRTATIRSIGAVEVLELDRDALTSLINRYPVIAQRLRALYISRAEHTVEVVRRTLRT